MNERVLLWSERLALAFLWAAAVGFAFLAGREQGRHEMLAGDCKRMHCVSPTTPALMGTSCLCISEPSP